MGRVTRASYAVLVASTIAHFFNHIYTGALSPFLPIIRDELSLTLTEAGIVTSAAVLTMTISHLVVGYLGDRGWRDIFIPASILLAAGIMLVSSYATTFLFLTSAMLLLGVGASGYHPSVFPALAEKFPKSSRATATGIQAIGGLVGMALIPFLGVTLLVMFGGWRESFVLLSLAGFALFVPVTALMLYSRKACFSEEEGQEEGDGSDGWTLNFALLVVLMALRGMSFRCTTLLMPLYLVESEYSYDPILAGSFTTVMLVAGLVGEIVSAPLSDRVGKRVPFLIVSTGVSTPFLLLLNASLSQVALLLVLIAVGFFFFLGVPPNTAYQTEVVPKQSQGLAFGLLFSIGAIPGSLSPILFGWIGDVYGLPMSIVFLVVTTGLATIFAALLKETSEPRDDASTALDLIRVPD